MKFHSILLVLSGLILPAAGQEKEKAETIGKAPVKWEVEVPEPIADGTPSKSPAKPVPIDFKIISSRTKKVDVVETPEMHDLPPITGRINVTVRMVEDPNLPVPPEPLPALEPDDPAVVARMAELSEKYRGTTLVFISASVYNHKRTLLRIHTNSETRSQVVAWSNLDFNNFCGLSSYRVKDAVDGTLYDYGVQMGIGNEDTVSTSESESRSGDKYEAPKIPELPNLAKSGPAFVVIGG